MTIHFRKTIPLPVAKVFQQFADVNFIPKISGAKSKQITKGKNEKYGVGATRKITIIPFLFYLHEEITRYEPDETIAYKIVNLSAVKHHIGVLKFEPIDEKSTLLQYTIEFEASFSWLTKMICRILERKINAGLDSYIKKVSQ